MSTASPEGDVYVSPVYLAGSTFTGDPALLPLLSEGFRLHLDELGNVFVSSPDQRFRLGYLPEGDDSTLWKITAHTDPFGSPRWLATFDDNTPTELVTAFTTALAENYRNTPDVALRGEASNSRGFQPLGDAGWKAEHGPRLSIATSPDGLAEVTYFSGLLNHEEEVNGYKERWTAAGGHEGYDSRWTASFSTHTPTHLIAATMTALTDPTPVERNERHIPQRNRGAARITPVNPPVPSPLDVRQTAAARARSVIPRPITRPLAPVAGAGAALPLRSARRR
ncbi:DUF317 domain-containing protein [Streptomyces sp. G1]|uniref:DUF317 domain-containing protein n=1 Tax=Streptomyces sp. G1 TaxID=361572 RepID=UPI00202F00AD|nr:DUF317 domain-containing protein [Streptomyces sp. G1]MCM1967982.1 DUF317 domain-containing protein [Streptomyces sp. G1]